MKNTCNVEVKVEVHIRTYDGW